MSIKIAHSSISVRMLIQPIEIFTIFAPTLRIRGSAEVRPPNVKGTVMQTSISGYVGSPHRSRFFIYHNCQKATILLGIFGIIRSSADGLRNLHLMLNQNRSLHDSLPSLHRMWRHHQNTQSSSPAQQAPDEPYSQPRLPHFFPNCSQSLISPAYGLT